MLEEFQELVISKYPFLNEREVYLAISGGKDSMALSHLLLNIGIKHTLLHCNFKLRGVDSDEDESFLKEYANEHQLVIHTKSFDTKGIAEERKQSIQEVARELRYTWFNSFLKQNAVLLTAHHQDDSVETFFINLVRGTGIRGLTGINNRGNTIIRPLLDFSSSQIKKYIEAHSIAFRQDQSNFENKYLRNNLRNKIIPLLEEQSTDFKKKIRKTISSLNAVSDWMVKKVNEFKVNHFVFNDDHTYVNKDILLKEDPIFIEFLMNEFGIHRSNNESFIRFLNAQSGSKFLTAHFEFVLDRDKVCIQVIRVNNPISNVVINEPNENIAIGNRHFITKVSSAPVAFNHSNIQQFDLSTISFPLTIRPWSKGDRIRPLGMKGHKLVSDILIDKKIGTLKKKEVLVIEDSQSRLICIVGLQISDLFKLNDWTTSIFHLEEF